MPEDLRHIAEASTHLQRLPAVGYITNGYKCPDGRSLIYADSEYVLRRLILDPEDLVEEARHRVTRELTQDECNTYLGPDQCEPSEAAALGA